MANIAITRYCRRNCEYCFAREERARGVREHMSEDVYLSALDFLQDGDVQEIRLLGGEPSEHPEFVRFVELALMRGHSVLIFTGGLLSDDVMGFLSRLPSEKVTVIMNTLDPERDPPDQVSQQMKVCRGLSRRVLLGFNISSPLDTPLFLFDWIEDMELMRALRLGLAHPIWGGDNRSYPWRRPEVIPILEVIMDVAEKKNISVHFDCGFTPCMFTPEFVESHPRLFGHEDEFRNEAETGGEVMQVEQPLGQRCRPTVDILPEGDCIYCFALSRALRLPLPESGGRPALIREFDRRLEGVLPDGIFPECSLCEYLERGLCGGGCRARRASRLRPDPDRALALQCS